MIRFLLVGPVHPSAFVGYTFTYVYHVPVTFVYARYVRYFTGRSFASSHTHVLIWIHVCSFISCGTRCCCSSGFTVTVAHTFTAIPLCPACHTHALRGYLRLFAASPLRLPRTISFVVRLRLPFVHGSPIYYTFAHDAFYLRVRCRIRYARTTSGLPHARCCVYTTVLHYVCPVPGSCGLPLLLLPCVTTVTGFCLPAHALHHALPAHYRITTHTQHWFPFHGSVLPHRTPCCHSFLLHLALLPSACVRVLPLPHLRLPLNMITRSVYPTAFIHHCSTTLLYITHTVTYTDTTFVVCSILVTLSVTSVLLPLRYTLRLVAFHTTRSTLLIPAHTHAFAHAPPPHLDFVDVYTISRLLTAIYIVTFDCTI